MTTPTIAEYLKYANLQIAAEAFLVNNDGSFKPNLIHQRGHASDNEPTGFWILRRTEMKKTNERKREMSLRII